MGPARFEEFEELGSDEEGGDDGDDGWGLRARGAGTGRYERGGGCDDMRALMEGAVAS